MRQRGSLVCAWALLTASLLAMACSSARASDDSTPAALVGAQLIAPANASSAVSAASAALPDPQPLAPDPLVAPAPLLAGRRICIDPGHDAILAVGATGKLRGGGVPTHPVEGVRLYEHELVLGVSYRLKALLEADGAAVCVTRLPREEGGGHVREPYDYNGDGRVRAGIYDTPEIVQPRIDIANDFGAEVLVSVHFNGSEDPSIRGVEAYYTDAGPTASEGKLLASDLIAGLLAEYRDAGHDSRDRGARSDRYQRYSTEDTRRIVANFTGTIRANGHDPATCSECYRLMTPGNNPMSLHRGSYIGVVMEVEFLSNPNVVERFIMRPDSLDIIASGLARGLRSYFASH